MKIPFILFAAAYMSAMLIFFHMTQTLRIIFLAVFLIVLILSTVFAVKSKNKENYNFILSAVLILLGICLSFGLSFSFSARYESIVSKYNGKVISGSGFVSEKSIYDGYTSITVKTDSINGEKERTKIKLLYFEDGDIELYSKISFEAQIVEREDKRLGFDSKEYYKSEGIYLSGNIDKFEKIKEPNWFFRWVKNANEKIHSLNSTSKNASILDALTIADKSTLDDDTEDIFKELGISHILAVSGFHISTFAMMLYSFLSHLSVHKYISCTFSIAFAIFYMAMTGFTYSVVRAGIMIIFSMIVSVLRYEKDSLSSLLFSGTLIVTLNLFAVLNVGFLLSFGATLGIIVCAFPAMDKFFSGEWYTRTFYAPSFLRKIYKVFFDYIVTNLFITIAACLFTLPVMLFYFNNISLLAPITNLIFILPFEIVLLLMPFCIVTSVFGGIGSFAENINMLFIKVIDVLLDISLWLMRKISEIVDGNLSVNYRFVFIIALVAVISIILLFIFKSKDRYPQLYILLSAILVLSCFAGNLLERRRDKFIAMNISGQTNLLVKSGGDNILISAENYRSQSLLFSFLEYNNVSKIDFYILGEPEKYDADRLKELDRKFKIGEILYFTPSSKIEYDIINAAAEYADENNIKMTQIKEGQINSCGKTEITPFRRKNRYIICNIKTDEGRLGFLYNMSESTAFPAIEEKIDALLVMGRKISRGIQKFPENSIFEFSKYKTKPDASSTDISDMNYFSLAFDEKGAKIKSLTE